MIRVIRGMLNRDSAAIRVSRFVRVIGVITAIGVNRMIRFTGGDTYGDQGYEA